MTHQKQAKWDDFWTIVYATATARQATRTRREKKFRLRTLKSKLLNETPILRIKAERIETQLL